MKKIKKRFVEFLVLKKERKNILMMSTRKISRRNVKNEAWHALRVNVPFISECWITCVENILQNSLNTSWEWSGCVRFQNFKMILNSFIRQRGEVLKLKYDIKEKYFWNRICQRWKRVFCEGWVNDKMKKFCEWSKRWKVFSIKESSKLINSKSYK